MDVKALLRETREGKRFELNLAKGCISMYRATGDGQYRDAVLDYLNGSVSSDGQLLFYNPNTAALSKASLGTALFFGWDETAEERYRSALRQIMEEIKRLYRIRGKAFNDLIALPFQSFEVGYDNRFGNKQSYKAVAWFFQGIRQEEYDKEKQLYQYVFDMNTRRTNYHSLTLNSQILISLADTVEQMDIQLYEHYRVLADLFLEAVRGMMSYRLEEISLFSKEMTDRDKPDLEGCVMAAYALLKGVRLNLLDEEKYLPIAENMVYAMEKICGARMLEDGFPGDLGFRLMAEAEIREAGVR